MRWQPRILLAVGLAASSGCHGDRPAVGIAFETVEVDLGRLPSGSRHQVRFPFQVGSSSVLIERIDTTCGCASPRVEVDGRTLAPGVEIPAGAVGQVSAELVTTGFSGPKLATLTVQGSGLGLPAELRIRCDLEPWCRIEPPVLQLGVLDGSEAVRREVAVTAEQPFRLTRELSVPPPLALEGLPSAQPARRQVFQVVVPADAPAGRHSRFLQVRADNGLDLQLPVVFELAPLLYVIPDRLLLGAVRQGVEVQATVDVGVREGRLAPPTGRLEGFGKARVDTVTLEEGRRYRMRLHLPMELDPGPLRGELRLEIRHTTEAGEERVERVLPVFAVVQTAPDPQSPQH